MLVYKIGRPLPQLTKTKKVITQINRTRNEHGTIAVDIEVIQNIIRQYFINLHQIGKSKRNEWMSPVIQTTKVKLRREQEPK